MPLNAGFEGPEGFAPGPIDGQAGWRAVFLGDPEGHISTANPAAGTQHLRISYDPALPSPSDTGAFSPDAGVLQPGPSTTTIDVAISAAGGADYTVFGQSTSQQFLTWEVNFSFLGNIWVLDDLGGGLTSVDSGQTWAADGYNTLVVCDDPSAGMTEYWLNGVKFYSQVTHLGGTRVEQVAIFSDNFHLDDEGDFDDLSVEAALSPLCLGIPLGACCFNMGPETTECVDGVTGSTCSTMPEPRSFKQGLNCVDVTCSIPTVSAWGLVILSLLLLTTGTVSIQRPSRGR